MPGSNRQTQTQVVRRIADILRLWISHRGTMSVREVAERLGLARTTTHRLMADLENEGFLRSDGNGRYELGFFPVRLAERVREGLKIVEVARSHMMALRDLSRETVALHIRDDIVRRCIYQVESPQQLRRVYTDVGGSIPLYAGAASLVMLAHLPEEALQRIVDDGLQPIAPNTITDWPKLREEMDRILEEGVAVSRSQRTPGIAAVAAPIWDSRGEVVGSINITGPQGRFSDERVDEFRSCVRETAERISHDLGSSDEHGR